MREKPVRARSLSDRLSLGLFLIACALVVFFTGLYLGGKRMFPYTTLSHAKLTVLTLLQNKDTTLYSGEALSLPFDVNAPRMSVLQPGGGTENVLLYGGLNQFLDICPQLGCAAVEMNRAGAIVHSWPYRPVEIHAANMTPQYAYEMLNFDPVRTVREFGAKPLPGGDLLITFQRQVGGALAPYGGGIARIGPDGRPRWFRFDYTKHWPTVTADNKILTPYAAIGVGPIAIPAGTSGDKFSMACEEPFIDGFRILDLDGHEIHTVDLYQTLIKSRFRGVLRNTPNGCDPIHLNYVDVLRPSAAGAVPGGEPGDYVISMRNLDLIGIIDKDDYSLKQIFRGPFSRQHSVHHLDGSKFLIFDNLGDSRRGEAARLLLLDVATGQATTVFPKDADLPRFANDAFSDVHGYISISADRTRAIVAFARSGVAFEVRISDGKVLTVYRGMQPTSTQPGAVRKLFETSGVEYAGNH